MELPKADLYVCTGDMLPNYEQPVFASEHSAMVIDWEVNRELEVYKQGQFLRKHRGAYRKLLQSPDAPVVVVRGNHDFVPLAALFGGEVYEIGKDATDTLEVGGLKIGGFRGIRKIGGEWSDEYELNDLDDVARDLPDDLNLVVTHVPTRDVRDEVRVGHKSEFVGCTYLTSYFNRNMYGKYLIPRTHLFGHIHECFGTTSKGEEGHSILFSNAATGFVSIHLKGNEFISNGLGRLRK